MILPDANLLLYAYDSASPFQRSAAAWWKGCVTGAEPVGLVAVVIFAFVRIGTSRRAFEQPMTVAEAAGHVRGWLEQPIVHFLPAQASDVSDALAILEAAGTGGNLTTDAQIAAIARRSRAIVHTADLDFGRFPGVRWHNPIAPSP